MLIEIFADVICPWCYIGRGRLARALESRRNVPVAIRWQPFQLNPTMPRDGMDRDGYLVSKFGSVERVRSLNHAVLDAATADGLPLNLDRVRRTPNTADAHRLIRIAERQGLGTEMVDALMSAYFVDGVDIGDPAALCALAATVGLDEEKTASLLASDAEMTAVRASDLFARQLGLHAVPCFVFDRRFVISGAQDPACFRAMLAIEPTSAVA